MRRLGPRCWRSAVRGLRRARRRKPSRRRPEPGPELDFLEYLGAWAEEDDEWLAIEEWQKDNALTRSRGEEDAEESESERDDDDESE